MIGCGWVHPPSPLPAGVTRVEVVHDATAMGAWIGPRWRTGDEFDVHAFGEYCRNVKATRPDEVVRIVLDIESTVPHLNADIRRGSVTQYTALIGELAAQAHAADVLFGVYDNFHEGFNVLTDRIEPHLTKLRDANNAMAPAIEACDFHVCKFYIAETRNSDAYILQAVKAYCDEAVRSSRGKPVYMLMSARVYWNQFRSMLTPRQIRLIVNAILSRDDIAGIIQWEEPPYVEEMNVLSEAAVEAVRQSEA